MVPPVTSPRVFTTGAGGGGGFCWLLAVSTFGGGGAAFSGCCTDSGLRTCSLALAAAARWISVVLIAFGAGAAGDAEPWIAEVAMLLTFNSLCTYQDRRDSPFLQELE
jgi:hypothetical protein